MIHLTEQQQRDLASEHENPPCVVNPSTQERFVLIHAELFERVRAILDQEDDIESIREMYPLMLRATEDEGEQPSHGRESA